MRDCPASLYKRIARMRRIVSVESAAGSLTREADVHAHRGECEAAHKYLRAAVSSARKARKRRRRR